MTEGPYRLPDNWRWVKLGEVCEVIMGQSPPSRTYNQDGIGLPFYQGKADFGELYPTPRMWCFSPQKIAYPGDVLISVRAPVGPTNLVNAECCIGRGLAALRPNDCLDRFWLLFYLRSTEGELATSGTGSTFTAITKKDLENIPIPLPPLEEQRRIVARIEELIARVREAKRLRQEAKEEVERLWQATLAQVFPRPGQELPPGWRWVRLDEVASRETQVINPSDYPENEFNYIGMENIASNQWHEPEPNLIRGKHLKSACIVFHPGQVLYGKLRPYLNKVVLCSREGIASTEFIPLSTNPVQLAPAWLAAFLRTPWFVKYASSHTTGSRQPRVRLDAFWNTPIPLPPLAEQWRIVTHLEAVQEKICALKAVQEETDKELKRLEQAILDKAFRGEL